MKYVVTMILGLVLASQAQAAQYPGTPPNAVPLAYTTGLQATDNPVTMVFAGVAGWTNFVTQVICSGQLGETATLPAQPGEGLLGRTINGSSQLDMIFAITVGADKRIGFNVTLEPALPGIADSPLTFLMPQIAGGSVACNMLGYRIPNGQLQ